MLYPDEVVVQGVGVLIALYVVYRGYRGILKGRERRIGKPYVSMRERKKEAERERKGE